MPRLDMPSGYTYLARLYWRARHPFCEGITRSVFRTWQYIKRFGPIVFRISRERTRWF